jgi:hypothetical protein
VINRISLALPESCSLFCMSKEYGLLDCIIGKVKVKLSLSLVKHRARKTFGVLETQLHMLLT